MVNQQVTDGDIAAVVAAAVQGERERCAKIAADFGALDGATDDVPRYKASTLADAIAASIRNPRSDKNG